MTRRFRLMLASIAWLAAATSLFLPRWGLSVASVFIWLGFVATRATRDHFRFSLRWLFGLILAVAATCWLITLFNKMIEMAGKDLREKKSNMPMTVWRN